MKIKIEKIYLETDSRIMVLCSETYLFQQLKITVEHQKVAKSCSLICRIILKKFFLIKFERNIQINLMAL